MGLKPRRAIIDGQPAFTRWAIGRQPRQAFKLPHTSLRQCRVPHIGRDTDHAGSDVRRTEVSQFIECVRLTPTAADDNLHVDHVPHHGFDQRQLFEGRFLSTGLRVQYPVEIEKKGSWAWESFVAIDGHLQRHDQFTDFHRL